MSEGDDRIHGYSPNATIFYDCAFPLSTNKTGDNDLPSAAQPPYRDEITLPTSPLPISQRTGDTLSLRAGENLNVKKKNGKKNLIPGIAVSGLLPVSVPSSVSSWSGGPISNLGEAVEDEQLLQA